MPDPEIDVAEPTGSDGDWGPVQLDGGQLYQTGGQRPPRVTQTGSWSDPSFPADQGQDGDA